MAKKRLEEQLRFILEINKEKNVFRQTHLDGDRRENDAEHSWHIAIMIYLLKEYANEAFDAARAMMMALIHDVVEIDAGDTYAYDSEGISTQREREEKAARRIFGLLPNEQRDEMIALFNEFEACKTPESRFAHVMDNLQPMLLNHSHDGADWRAHQVTKSQIYHRNKDTEAGSEALWEYIKELVAKNVAKGNIKDE